MRASVAPESVAGRLRRRLLLNALLLGLVGLLSLTYPVAELSRRAGDLYFRLRAPEPISNQVALVLIDDASLQAYGRWPWKRRLLARLVQAVSGQHPRAIGVDILLSEPEDEADDGALAATFAQAGNVVLAAKIGSGLESTAWVEPLPIFARSAAAVGHVQAELGPDGICRRVPAREMTTSGPRPAFALEVARVAQGRASSLPSALASSAPVQMLVPEFLTVDYRGQDVPGETPFLFFSTAELLDGKGGGQLRDRAVLIGFGSTEISDRLPTPVSDQLPMPGVEIHANLVDGLLAGRRLRPLATGLQLILLTGTSLLLTTILLRRPGWQGLLAVVLVMTAGYAGGYWLFASHQRVIAFGPFLCLSILAAPLVQLENLVVVDRGLTRSLRQLKSVLQPLSATASGELCDALRPQVSQADLHSKVATVSQLEAELSSLYAFDQTLLESMQDGLAVFEPGGKLVFRNALWEESCQKLNWDPNPSLQELLMVMDKPEWLDLLAKQAGVPTRLETELLHGDGLWQLRAVRLPSTVHVGSGALMVIVTDLTARLERDRARAEALGFVTHELRTPLVSIQGFAEFLLRYKNGPGSEEAAKTIFQESKRLVAMINTYLDVLRLESGVRPLRADLVDVTAMVTQVENVMRPLAQAAEVRVQVRMESDLPALRGDAQLLGGALLNLVSNAVKYSPRGSEVGVFVMSTETQLSFEVANRGPEVPSEDLERLFEPFYRRPQAEGAVRGWGLGLAFVRRIAEAHHGEVEASSSEAGGTRFRMVLPATRIAVCEVDS